KWHAFFPVFGSLLLVQLVGFFLSLSGVSQMHIHVDFLSIAARDYAANLIIISSMLWMLVTAIALTSRTYRETDFLFVATRLSSHLSHGAFLLTAAFLAG